MLTRSRRSLLVALPLLLLVPLGVAKWQSDHRPLSQMDQQLRVYTADAAWVYISGAGAYWRRLTGLQDDDGLLIQEPTILRDLVETLHCTNEETRSVMGNYDGLITLGLPTADAPHDMHQRNSFTYFHCPQDDYLGFNTEEDAANGVRVRPRSAPQFEALIAQLAQRARAKGKHPEIVRKYIGEPAE